MTEYAFTPEEKVAWETIEKRAALFVERMARVSRLGTSSRGDTCGCCGYPFLTFGPDEAYWCLICGWYDGNDPDDVHVIQDPQQPGAVPLAHVRVMYLSTGWSLSSEERGYRIKLTDTPERAKLIAALDALGEDSDPANDAAHWRAIREAYEPLARLQGYNDGGTWVQWRGTWYFAEKVDPLWDLPDRA